MSTCCAINSVEPTPCPQCGIIGPIVRELPVSPHLVDPTEGPWQFCPNQQCPAIYYLADVVVDDQQVITQVANKATDKSTPICFCFAHTADDILEDLQTNGTSTIQASVKDAVANALCACEHLNPSQKCCLPDVRRAVKAAHHRLELAFDDDVGDVSAV